MPARRSNASKLSAQRQVLRRAIVSAICEPHDVDQHHRADERRTGSRPGVSAAHEQCPENGARRVGSPVHTTRASDCAPAVHHSDGQFGTLYRMRHPPSRDAPLVQDAAALSSPRIGTLIEPDSRNSASLCRHSSYCSSVGSVFGRHLAATNSTYRASTSARPDRPTTTSNDDIPTIPDQPRELLPEKQPAASPITGISTVMRGSRQAEHRGQRVVNRPHLVRREAPNSSSEPLSIDSSELLDEHSCCFTGDHDFGSKRCGPSAARSWSDDYDGSRKELVCLHEDPEALTLLFVADSLGDLESIDLTALHASTPSAQLPMTSRHGPLRPPRARRLPPPAPCRVEVDRRMRAMTIESRRTG